jgi:hypothetical protein
MKKQYVSDCCGKEMGKGLWEDKPFDWCTKCLKPCKKVSEKKIGHKLAPKKLEEEMRKMYEDIYPTPSVKEEKEFKFTSKDKLLYVTQWLFINQGTFNSAKSWRIALVEMLQTIL